MFRDRTIASTCGLSIEFKKGVFIFVPPPLYQEVIAAGGVSEEDMLEVEAAALPSAPEVAADRKAAIFKAYEAIVLKNQSTDFTAGGAPHIAVVSAATGWSVQAKERDATWTEFKQGA